VRQQYEEEYKNINEHSQLQYVPSFGYPYSVLVNERFIDYYQLQPGEMVELEFETEGGTQTTYGKVRQIPDEIFDYNSKEAHARILAAYATAGHLSGRAGAPFDELPTLDDERADLPTDDELRAFINSVGEHLNDLPEQNVHLFVGAGILETVHGKRNPGNLLSQYTAPIHFDLERDRFVDYMADDGPALSDMSLYLGDITEPEHVYFTHYGERLSEEQRETVRRTITDNEVFQSNWNYTLPGYNALVGPTTTEETAELVRITEEALEVVPGIQRTVAFQSEDGTRSTGINGDGIYEAIEQANLQFESLATSSRYGSESGQLPIRQDGESLYFLFDQVTLVLTAKNDAVEWSLPDGIDPIEKIISAVNDIIRGWVGAAEVTVINTEPPRTQRISQTDWAFDTNSLYHDHVADQPTSILHTLFSHRFFYQSTIHISWAVLFEMNKHPESGSASEAPNEQGFENLAILRTLEDLGFLTVNVQKPPSKIRGNLGNGDIADIYILAHAEEQDARLITGDESLRDIALLSDATAVDIFRLDSLGQSADNNSPTAKIRSQVGTTLHCHEDIVSELSDVVSTRTTVPRPNSGTQQLDDPEAILESWCSKGELVPFYRDASSGKCYAQHRDITLIPTDQVLSYLPAYLGPDDEYLNEDCLKQIAEDVSELGNAELPAPELIVPWEYVVENGSSENSPSDFNTGLLNLSQAKNVEYTARPAATSQPIPMATSNVGEESGLLKTNEYRALCLASNIDSCYLLLPEERNAVWKFTNLLGLDYATIEARDADSE
jgi:predicted nucleic acid-binding protein